MSTGGGGGGGRGQLSQALDSYILGMGKSVMVHVSGGGLQRYCTSTICCALFTPFPAHFRAHVTLEINPCPASPPPSSAHQRTGRLWRYRDEMPMQPHSTH